MKLLLVVTLCLKISILHGRMYQEQYHVVDICKEHAPPAVSIFFSKTVEDILSCVILCQINLACQSFAYQPEAKGCLQSRLKVNGCDDLESLAGTVTYKVDIYKDKHCNTMSISKYIAARFYHN